MVIKSSRPHEPQTPSDNSSGKSKGTLSFYEILEVNKNVSQKDIRQAYYKLALKYHPDRIPLTQKNEKYTTIILWLLKMEVLLFQNSRNFLPR